MARRYTGAEWPRADDAACFTFAGRLYPRMKHIIHRYLCIVAAVRWHHFVTSVASAKASNATGAPTKVGTVTLVWSSMHVLLVANHA